MPLNNVPLRCKEPFAFHETPRLTWEAGGADRLRGAFNDGTTKVTVEFDIDGEGRVLGGSAIRPRLLGKAFVDTGWSGAYREYQTFDGVRVPTVAEVSWLLPEGPFMYWRGRVTEFRLR